MKIRIIAALLLFCLVFSGHARAQVNPGGSDFGLIPILHEGRIKPMDSFARSSLHALSGSKNIQGGPALNWLARALFDPGRAAHDEIIRIDNPDIKEMMGLPAGKNYFNLPELEHGLHKTTPQITALLSGETDNLTPSQKSLLALHDAVIQYNHILRSFTLILPLEIDVPDTLARSLPSSGAERTYLSLLRLSGPAAQKPAMEQFARNLQNIGTGGAWNTIFRVIPVSWDKSRENWVSPWTLVLEGLGSPDAAKTLDLWADLARAYREGDQTQWENAARDLHNTAAATLPPAITRADLSIERIYNAARPYFWAAVFYALSIITAIQPVKRFSVLAPILMLAGVLSHAGAQIARVMILDRPPLGTLYETVLFVSLICAVTSLLIYAFGKRKDLLILICGALSAALLLLIAPVLRPRADSLEVLVAVLNTGFWLGTHVLVITTGYGLCILTATISHFALIHKTDSVRQKWAETARLFSYAALLFTTVGTILGGIWADQSWGRFWGWDPKENGALLIVLWLIWLQHGRLSGHIGPIGFLAGLCALNIVVAVTWFGVNLLGVGLHSYGFTSGLAEGLLLFCVVQAAIIAALVYRALRMRHKQNPDPGKESARL